MGGKRQAGWPSLWVTFLLAMQREQEHRVQGAFLPGVRGVEGADLPASKRLPRVAGCWLRRTSPATRR
jgi:hypothetical protein